MLRTPLLRQLRAVPRALPTVRHNSTAAPVAPSNTSTTPPAYPLSNPTLANIEKRWPSMPPQEQAELWMALRDRMVVDWNELTLHEKKAAYWIAFGPHGPRAVDPPGEGLRVFSYTLAVLATAGVIFGLIRYFANPPPRTMNKEWQEASNEFLLAQKNEPITGLSSEGYNGPGMVQSKPKKPE